MPTKAGKAYALMIRIRVKFSARGYERLGFLTSDAQVPAKSNLYSKSNVKEIKISCCILFISIGIDEQKYSGLTLI